MITQVFFSFIMLDSTYSFDVFTLNKKQKKSILYTTFSIYLLFVSATLVLAFTHPKYSILYLLLSGIFTFVVLFLFYKNSRSIFFKTGTFTGKLTFSTQYICINDEKIDIQTIKCIKISNPDFAYKYHKEHFLSPYLSMGINNKLIIENMKGEKHSYLFHQKFDNEIMRIEALLEYYVEKQLMDKENLRKITTQPFL